MFLREACGVVLGRMRTQRNMSKHAAARRSGFDESHWGRIEQGLHWPSHKTIYNICEGFGITPSELLLEIAKCMSAQEHQKNDC